jgi:hypothetical protein
VTTTGVCVGTAVTVAEEILEGKVAETVTEGVSKAKGTTYE